jgi:queuine tRNA-ribosyltransferase
VRTGSPKIRSTGSALAGLAPATPRGYLHHLMKCREPLGPRLLSVHNLHHYLALMARARAAIDEGRYAAFAREALAAVDRHEHDASGR